MAPLLEFLAELFQGLGQGSRDSKRADEKWRERQVTRARRGEFRGRLRVTSGSHPQVERAWRGGDQIVTPGRIVQGRVTVDITEALWDLTRPGGAGERIYQQDETVVFILRADAVEIEWLVLAFCAEYAQAALDPR